MSPKAAKIGDRVVLSILLKDLPAMMYPYDKR